MVRVFDVKFVCCDRLVESQLEETKEKLSNERVTCAKYEAQLHLANERHQSMKRNMENNKKVNFLCFVLTLFNTHYTSCAWFFCC